MGGPSVTVTPIIGALSHNNLAYQSPLAISQVEDHASHNLYKINNV